MHAEVLRPAPAYDSFVSAPSSDLHGISRMTLDAVAGVVGLVEAMHLNIASAPRIVGAARQGPTSGITGLVYRSIRGVIGVVRHGLDRLLARLDPLLGQRSTWPGREALLAALNGVLGDYLEASANPLAIRMRVRRDGRPLPSDTRYAGRGDSAACRQAASCCCTACA